MTILTHGPDLAHGQNVETVSDAPDSDSPADELARFQARPEAHVEPPRATSVPAQQVAVLVPIEPAGLVVVSTSRHYPN